MVRMTAPVVLTSLLLLVVGVGAAWHVHRLQNRVSADLKANVSSLHAAEELILALHQIHVALQHYQLTGERKYLEAVPALRGNTERWLAESERWGTAASEKEMMARVRRGHDQFFGDLDHLLQAPSDSLPGEVKRMSAMLDHEVIQPTQAYLSLNARESEESIAENQVFATWLIWALLLLGTCGSVAGLLAGFGFARAFQRSLVQLSVPIRAAAGHFDEVIGPLTVTATTDLHEMEHILRGIAERIGAMMERLRQSEREVLRAEQLAAVGQMAAGMAHELRNPLTSMKILVQAASAGGTADAPEPGGLRDRDLVVLDEEITRLERLIQSFLEFARPPQPHKRIQDVKPLVAEAVQLIQSRAAMCTTGLELDLPSQQVRAAVDAAQFRQVLLNLLLNALAAIGSGGIIGITLRREPEGWLSLCVTDNGCGLPSALGNRIFAPFVTTKETGLGLGLSICKRIVEAHGGEIMAADRPEGGAVFTVRLPPPGEE
jgi:signal transduction histidine kinase